MTTVVSRSSTKLESQCVDGDVRAALGRARIAMGLRFFNFFSRERRTAQPFGRVRTPGTDQTTRKRVSRRSTSICVGNRVRRSTIETVQRTDVASWDRWRAKIGDRHTCRACDCASPASFSKS